LASASDGRFASGIQRGDVLVALPEGLEATEMRRMGNQILQNERIQELLNESWASNRKPPTIAKLKKKKRKKRKKKKKRGRCRDLQDMVDIDSQNSTDDSRTTAGVDDSMEEMERAMEHAAYAAAVSNRQVSAAVVSDDEGTTVAVAPSNEVMGLPHPSSLKKPARSLASVRRNLAAVNGGSTDSSSDGSSHDGSSKSSGSWSRSTSRDGGSIGDDSANRRNTIARRRRLLAEQRLHRLQWIRLGNNVLMFSLAFMIMYYLLDPNGYAARRSLEHIASEKLGGRGFFQFLGIFGGLTKVSRFFRMTRERAHNSLCPFVRHIMATKYRMMRNERSEDGVVSWK